MAGSSKKVILAALIGNGLISITKFIASFMTGSAAMFSEGIHSVVDTGNQVLLLYGLKQSQKPPDERFPFGYGKEIYFWCFIVAILIFAMGAGFSIYEGVHHMLHPTPLRDPTVNYVVLVLSMIFEAFAWYFAFKEFKLAKGDWSYLQAVRRGKDPTLFVVLFEDSAAMLGLIVAFIGIFLGQVTGNPIFDGAASVAIGLILALTAIWLAIETKGLLIGESANTEVVQGIRNILGTEPVIEHINEVLTMHMGGDFVLATIGVDFADTTSADDVEKCIAKVVAEIKKQFPEIKRVFIEAEKRKIT